MACIEWPARPAFLLIKFFNPFETNSHSGSVVVFGAFGAEGCWFESHSSRHVGTLGKSCTHSCLYDMMWPLCGCLVAKFYSCNSLLSSIHTLPVSTLLCVRLYIKRKYCYYS